LSRCSPTLRRVGIVSAGFARADFAIVMRQEFAVLTACYDQLDAFGLGGRSGPVECG
jgi:hypothetical protein